MKPRTLSLRYPIVKCASSSSFRNPRASARIENHPRDDGNRGRARPLEYSAIAETVNTNTHQRGDLPLNQSRISILSGLRCAAVVGCGRSGKLGVRSRNEVVRIYLEDRWVFCPCITDDLVGRSPSQGLEMLCEVVGCDEGQDMGLKAFQAIVVEDLHRGFLDGSVHSLSLAICPGVIGLSEPMLDAVFDAHAIEDVRAKEAAAGSFAVLGQIGEGHAVVCEHDVYLVGFHHTPQEG